jgi:phosphopantothenoylcysteine decarboxylase/phosphopantothenate--cysteine ligase
VESADEMYDMSVELFPSCELAILSAAVADYKPHRKSDEKLKREKQSEMTLELVRNKDIAAKLGRMKQPNQTVVGFALETADGMVNARKKLHAKKLDLIALNSLQDEGAGFRYDTNKMTLVDKKGTVVDIPLKSKVEVAEDIIEYLVKTKAFWMIPDPDV